MNTSDLADLQSSTVERPLRIDAVGISHLRHPIVVLDRSQAKQETVADIEMSVDLDAASRGAHLSRFLEVLEGASGELTMRTAGSLLNQLRARMGSSTALINATFPFFIEKRAPITGARGLLDVTCRFSFSVDNDITRFVLTVIVPVTTLCPCSQAVSEYGAHNQRCYVTVSVGLQPLADPTDDQIVWIEELVALAERHASAPIYPALKREDERFVTMQAFDHPAFVEDVARGVALNLKDDDRVDSFYVDVSSDESIHNHRAFARIGRPLV